MKEDEKLIEEKAVSFLRERTNILLEKNGITVTLLCENKIPQHELDWWEIKTVSYEELYEQLKEWDDPELMCDIVDKLEILIAKLRENAEYKK